ncbi:MAG TPA: hypothetical protein VF701_20995 [Thermoanaerobaculia bacterium]
MIVPRLDHLIELPEARIDYIRCRVGPPRLLDSDRAYGHGPVGVVAYLDLQSQLIVERFRGAYVRGIHSDEDR